MNDIIKACNYLMYKPAFSAFELIGIAIIVELSSHSLWFLLAYFPLFWFAERMQKKVIQYD